MLSLLNVFKLPDLNEQGASKWKFKKYSRSERNRRLLNISMKGQTRITDYWQIIDEIEHLITKNNNLKDSLLAQIEAINDSENSNASNCNGITDFSDHY